LHEEQLEGGDEQADEAAGDGALVPPVTSA